MGRKIVDAPDGRSSLNSIKFRRTRLPVKNCFHIRPCTPLHFGRYIDRSHQPESLMPVSAAQDAGVQHSAHRIKSTPPPGPGAAGCSGGMAEGKGFRRLHRRIISVRSAAPNSPRIQKITLMRIIPSKTGAHPVRTKAKATGSCFAREVRISTEQLHKAVMLKHVDRLQRPVMPREVEIAIHVATILPVRRKAANAFIDRAFLDPQA